MEVWGQRPWNFRRVLKVEWLKPFSQAPSDPYPPIKIFSSDLDWSQKWSWELEKSLKSVLKTEDFDPCKCEDPTCLQHNIVSYLLTASSTFTGGWTSSIDFGLVGSWKIKINSSTLIVCRVKTSQGFSCHGWYGRTLVGAQSHIGYALALANIGFCLCSGLIAQHKCIASQSSIHPGLDNNSLFKEKVSY